MFSLIALLLSYRRDVKATQRIAVRGVAVPPVVANDAAEVFARAA
ncbi:hypothetical protein [Sphingomonas liriopis]|nr:hypothetical protein [Sphingomonas liriopis]